MARALLLGAILPLGGCAFDVISIQQTPAHFDASASGAQQFTLGTETKVDLKEGYASVLRAGTVWKQVGRVDQGEVFHTKDQVVSVTASNQYQADIVVNDGKIAGFYLTVEHTFTAADPPVTFNVTHS